MSIIYSDSIQSQLDYIDAQIQASLNRISKLEATATSNILNQELIRIAKSDIKIYQETKAKILEIAIPKSEMPTEDAKQ